MLAYICMYSTLAHILLYNMQLLADKPNGSNLLSLAKWSAAHANCAYPNTLHKSNEPLSRWAAADAILFAFKCATLHEEALHSWWITSRRRTTRSRRRRRRRGQRPVIYNLQPVLFCSHLLYRNLPTVMPSPSPLYTLISTLVPSPSSPWQTLIYRLNALFV